MRKVCPRCLKNILKKTIVLLLTKRTEIKRKVASYKRGKVENCPLEHNNDNFVIKNFKLCRHILEECIDAVDVISFDVFDTLLLRPFLEPTDLFSFIEKSENASGFAIERIAAENRARNKKSQKEVSIDDIYENILPMFKRLKGVELETERKLLYSNLFIKEIYSYAVEKNKKIICISDMYLDENYISQVLYEKGFSNISKVYVSSHYYKTKGSGELFKVVLDDLKIRKENLFHIGDNTISDYEIPKKLGIKAFNIPNIHVYFEETKWNLSKKEDIKFSILQAMFAESLFYANQQNWSYYRNLGFHLAGPLVLSYLSFILKICKKNNIDKLLFVSRDSYSIMKIYEKYFFSKMKIDYEYVYVQRLIGLKSTLDYNGEPRYLKKILEEYKNDGYKINISDSYEDNKIEFDRNLTEIKKWAKNNNDELKNHIESVCGNSNNIALIDMTTGEFSSTKFIRNYIDDRLKISFYSGRYKDNWSYLYKTFSVNVLKNEDFRNIVLSEMLVSSPEDNVVGIKNNKPIYQKCITTNRKEVYEEIILGISDYTNRFISLFGSENSEYLLENFEEWFVIADQYFKSLNHDDLKYLKSWYHDDLFLELANTTLLDLK